MKQHSQSHTDSCFDYITLPVDYAPRASRRSGTK